MKVVVGPLSSFPCGAPQSVDVCGRAVAIFNVSGTLYALRDTCPHQGAKLSGGVIVGAVRANRPGCYTVDDTRPFVQCPWHGWEYDLATGESWYDPAHDRVKPYPVTIETGHAPGVGGERERGPYVAETVSVSVEDDYVVVEV